MKLLKLNELAKKAQTKTAMVLLLGVGVLILVGWITMHAKHEIKKEAIKPAEEIAGPVDSQFTQEASQKAVEEQQRQIKDLQDMIQDLKLKIEEASNTINTKSSDAENKTIEDLRTKIAELENTLIKKPELENSENLARGITTINFSYSDSQIMKKNAKDYVPPGTFARAVLLSGADTNAGVHGQTDTTPIVLKILDDGTLPNGKKALLKGCFVTAAAYGDASSERGQIRLQRLSCAKNANGYVLDIPIEGTINDMGGNDGIRGQVVMRNNNLIWNAGVSGVLSGIGSAMQQSLTTQSVSPLGATSAIQPGKVFQYGAFGGANTALGKLADYYIKLADMYHPIVQVHAGSQVNVVFLKGFSLTGESSEKAKNLTPDTATQESQSLLQNINDMHAGQAVDVCNTINNGENS